MVLVNHGRRSHPRRQFTRVIILMVLTAHGLLVGPPIAAATSPAVNQTDVPLVKAAIIYNICKFVEWPPGVVSGEEFVIGATAAQADEPDLSTLAGKQIHGRPIRIVEIMSVAALPSCDAVYLGKAQLDADPRPVVAGKPILTFGEAVPSGTNAPTIELVTDGSRIRFNVHRGAAERGGLRLSSQLLKLALSVTEN